MNKNTFVFTNKLIIDGSGTKPFIGDVHGENGYITDVIPTREVTEKEWNLERLVPGFIDIHTHSDNSLLIDHRGEGKLAQGVTLDIGGNCGSSAAPLSKDLQKERNIQLQKYGIENTWNTMEEYLQQMAQEKKGIQFATLVGYNTIRASVMGVVDAPPSIDEEKKIESLIQESLDAGAVGLSFGLIYPPTCFAKKKSLSMLLTLYKKEERF